MPSKKVNPAVPIVLDKERHLLFDLNAMVSFEDVTGKNLFKKGVSAALEKDISPKDIRALLWACLIHEDEGLTLKQVGSWIHAGNMLDIVAKITEAFSAAMPEGGEQRQVPFSEEAPNWLDLWAFGVYSLRLSSKQFWHLTLAQLDAITKRYQDEQERQNYRAALVCAVIANVNRNPKKHKAFQPEDFMPKQPKHKERLTTDEMLQHLMMLNAAYGGEVEEK